MLIAGTAMEILTLVWPLYTHFSKGSSTYGAVFALVFLLASWLYFLAEFILLGAVANRMHAGEPRRARAPRRASRASNAGRGRVSDRWRGFPDGGLTYDCLHHGNHLSVHRHDLRRRP